ncbi:MAG: lactonase family protein [Clostridium sp.]|nr:lactonase family protein [Clostridium sp.]
MNRETKKERAGSIQDGYIGTYFSGQSRGIYHFTFDPDSGAMTEPELFYEAKNAKWVSLKGNSMVFPIERPEGAGACFLEIKDGTVIREAEILEERQTPCYILQDGNEVYTANYHEGTVMVYHLDEGKPSLLKRIENGEGAGCHQILLHERWLLVPCLEQNRVRLFDRAHGYGPAGEIVFPEGTGPRHGVFNRDHSRFYMVSEWSNELFMFGVRGNAFTLMQTLSVLPEDRREDKGLSAAAIRLTGDERFLYISVRGADILSVFDVGKDRVSAIQHVTCGGAHPRDFILSGNEKFLLVANRFEGGIVIIERNVDDGMLKGPVHGADMPQGVALALEEVSLCREHK